MKKLISSVLCLFCLSAALLCGCAGSEEDLPGSEATGLLTEEESAAGTAAGSLLPELFSLPYLPGQTLDPITCPDGIQQTVSSLLYEGLFRLTPELEPEPWLCSSYTYDPAALTYTLQLRQNISFSDGTPLTAGDVKATLERAKLSPRYAARLADMAAVSAEESTLVITLSAPNSRFPALLDIPVVKADTAAEAVPVGTGPYLFSNAADSTALIANQLWWREASLPTEHIALVEAADAESLRYRLTSHDIQLVTADLAGPDPIPATGNIVYRDADTTVLQYIGLNLNREPMNSPAFRSLLDMGLDRRFLSNAFLSGHALPARFPVSPCSPLYPAALEQEYSLTAFTAAAAAAESSLSRPLILLVNEENSFKTALAAHLADLYSRQGIPMEVRALPWAEYTAALQSGDYDLYYGEVKLTADWDLAPLLGTGGALNYGGWSDPRTDALLAAYAAAEDPAQAMETLCRHLQDQNPILPLCFKRTSVLTQRGVVSGLQSTAAEPFYGISDCTIHLQPAVPRT